MEGCVHQIEGAFFPPDADVREMNRERTKPKTHYVLVTYNLVNKRHLQARIRDYYYYYYYRNR